MSSKSVVRRSNTPLLTYAILAVAAVGFCALYIYHRTQPQQRRDSEDENELEDTTEPQPRRRTERRVPRSQDRELNLASRLFRGATPKKKSMSISMKNVLLWNPSPDPEAPNHAFYENIVPFLHHLSQSYVIHLVCPINSSREKEQILGLLRNANLFSSNAIDERRVLFCETQDGKIHIIRHLEASVHIEGGTNGEETVEMVRGFVEKVIWVMQGGSAGNSAWAESSESKLNVNRNQWNNVEICQNLWTSSLNFELRNR
ncbi:12045_t:CDS:2 [Acaulospora morrowiae]|uniref:12045_t:CDS:1 n=1 Tax=Acaulospora morrowiae TaxID=94023 RepID=A0A9N8YY27_9GLOM|nr:12045_t:CDS:2 [Acaulospora morrowiae]